jgi:hypothetical protein
VQKRHRYYEVDPEALTPHDSPEDFRCCYVLFQRAACGAHALSALDADWKAGRAVLAAQGDSETEREQQLRQALRRYRNQRAAIAETPLLSVRADYVELVAGEALSEDALLEATREGRRASRGRMRRLLQRQPSTEGEGGLTAITMPDPEPSGAAPTTPVLADPLEERQPTVGRPRRRGAPVAEEGTGLDIGVAIAVEPVAVAESTLSTVAEAVQALDDISR